MADDTVTLTVSSDQGDDEVTLPRGLLDMLAEGEQNPAEVVGDLAMFGCAQRVHMTVHHSEGEVSEELQGIEAITVDLFEKRFGASYGEVTGHQH
jgi:hypothetical protein